MSLQTPKQPMMAQQPMSAKNNGGGGGVGGGGGSRPTTPTNTTNRPNSNDGTVRNTRGPGWLTKKPAKPSITPEFWCRPFMPNPPQLSDVANAYFIGYKDSSDWHFKKLLNVIDWFYRNGPGTFSFAAYLFRENKISFRPIQKNRPRRGGGRRGGRRRGGRSFRSRGRGGGRGRGRGYGGRGYGGQGYNGQGYGGQGYGGQGYGGQRRIYTRSFYNTSRSQRRDGPSSQSPQAQQPKQPQQPQSMANGKTSQPQTSR